MSWCCELLSLFKVDLCFVSRDSIIQLRQCYRMYIPHLPSLYFYHLNYFFGASIKFFLGSLITYLVPLYHNNTTNFDRFKHSLAIKSNPCGAFVFFFFAWLTKDFCAQNIIVVIRNSFHYQKLGSVLGTYNE